MHYNRAGDLRLLIEEINSIIDALMLVAHDDLHQLTYFVTAHELRLTQAGADFNRMIRNMQFLDILQQKSEHIKQAHAWMLAELPALLTKGDVTPSPYNLFRLNQLQFQLACTEYYEATTFVKEALALVQHTELFRSIDITRLLRHTNIVGTGLRVLNMKFSAAEALSSHDLQIPLQRVLALYSTNTEREVFKAYTNDPSISDTAIKDLINYKTGEFSSVEIF